MNALADNIRVGVAGWSYPDWEGFVYTGRIRDKLQFLAGYVDLIEINSTFYRPPDAKNADSWVRRTDEFPGFYFTAKLHQEVTHQGLIEPAMVRAFHDGLDPMVRAGKLRHLLAQFRYDFADHSETRTHLAAVRKNFGDLTNLVLELRHISWQAPQALEFLQSLGVTVANLDYPTAKNSFNLEECRVGERGYLRLHGRNAAAWFDKAAGRDQTYNYLYSRKELEHVRDRAIRLAHSFRDLTIVANNHYEGKEVANALQLKSMITGQKVRVPPGLVARYPELKEIAAGEPHGQTGSLF
ncbi:MAG: DUF72 domain-containing protein [Verrucomicrobiota bacterium]